MAIFIFLKQFFINIWCHCEVWSEKDKYLFRPRWRRCLRLFNLTVWSPGRLNIKYTEILPPSVRCRNITTILYLHQSFLHYSKVLIINHLERNNKYQRGLLMQIIEFYSRKLLKGRQKARITFISSYSKHQ